MPKLSFSELKHAVQNAPSKIAVGVTAVVVGATQSQAALTIDTTGIVADIATAGTNGVTIALLVGGALIAFGLVKRFIK